MLTVSICFKVRYSILSRHVKSSSHVCRASVQLICGKGSAHCALARMLYEHRLAWQQPEKGNMPTKVTKIRRSSCPQKCIQFKLWILEGQISRSAGHLLPGVVLASFKSGQADSPISKHTQSPSALATNVFSATMI